MVAPQGRARPDEEPIAVAHREFEEELGSPVPADELVPLGRSRSPAPRCSPSGGRGRPRRQRLPQQHLEIEWPPRSGRMQEFPEIDRAAWFGLDEARSKLLKGQVPFLDRLLEHLA